MNYLVVSDNHGDRDVLVDIVNKRQNQVDGMFHCGDSELPSTDPLWQKMIVVKGNCDFDEGYKTSQTIKTDSDVIYLTHGHLSNVRASLNQLAIEAEAAGATIALFGHTHELGAVYHQGTLFLNPGSILLPRGRYQMKTYAIIESSEEAYSVTYYDEKHQLIEELTRSFPK